MAEENNVHRNSFDGGLNTDLSKVIVNQNQYIEANNLSLVNTGTFLILEDIKGTAKIKDIITNTNTTTVLRAYATKYTVGTSKGLDGITIFTHTEDPSGTSNVFKISAYVFSTDTVYNIYQETVDDSYLVTGGTQYSETNERVIDGVLYPENGLDILYFTDYISRPKKLRCEIPTGYSGTAFLDAEDLELLQIPALGQIELDSTNGITTGGSLLTGTYQVAYQLYNPTSNKYSGFSLLTNPIHIYTAQTVTKQAGIGLPSNRKITLDITPTENELAYYTHFRLAIVENIGTADSINIGITPYEAIATYLSGSTIANYEIKSNQQYEFTTIDDVVIDSAAIQAVKTLAIKDNRLLLGNIKNQTLTYDAGTPTVASGSILRAVPSTSTNAAEQELFMSTKRGHFRNEVYRYAISYFDDYGNFSSPKVLDLRGSGVSPTITNNQMAANGIDVKFPSRGTYNGADYFTVMDVDNKIRHLGLELVDITNHPTWSRGFVILRAKRKKNILFQTPLVPMAKMSGIGAVGKYPTEYRTSSALDTVTDTTLSPMGPSTSFVPHNLFMGAPTSSPGTINTNGGTTTNTYQVGESQPLQYTQTSEFVMMFPPQNIYENNAYPFTGSEQFQTADAVICETYFNRFDPFTISNPGAKAVTSVSGSFFATRDKLNYFNDGHTKTVSTLRSATVPFKNVVAFDNYDEGGTLFGSNILDYTKLRTDGVAFGELPFNQRCAVSDFNATHLSTKFSPPTFAGASSGDIILYNTQTSTVGSYANSLTGVVGGFLMSTTGIWEVPATTKKIDGFGPGGGIDLGTTSIQDGFLDDGIATANIGDWYEITAGGGTSYDFDGVGPRAAITLQNGDTIRYDGTKWRTSKDYPINPFAYHANVLEISNVIAGLDDARYGKLDDYNEFIYTGTKVVFTNAEVASTRPAKTVQVWGGDCVVSPHSFKISDSTYTIVNNDKLSHAGGSALSTLGEYWEKVWLTSADAAGLCMPIFFKNAAQYLTVVLESTYNGAVVDHTDADVVYTDTLSDINVIGAPAEEKARFPRPYLYNINLNKENDQKIFVPVDSLTDTYDTYKSRVYYSDLKVYQTDIEGFNRVRVSNIYDLPETYGALTKLGVAGDRLFALQERGVAVLPVGERIIETTDTSQLAVRSGEFLGTPMYIDTLRGCQHIGSVVNTGTMLYFLDAINKAVCAIDGTVKVVSGNGLTSGLRSLFSDYVIDRSIIGAFDATRDQYYIVKKIGSNRFVYVWNQGLQKWESNIIFPELGFGDAVTVNNKFVIVGKDTTLGYTSVHEAHAGNYSQFMGTYSQPNVKFIVNPIPDVAKVYDALLVNSNAPLSTLTAAVQTDRNGVAALAGTTPFDTTRGEGNYKVKILRNTNGSQDAELAYIERLRGQYAIVELLWGYNTTATRTTPVNISSVLTKFRPSANMF